MKKILGTLLLIGIPFLCSCSRQEVDFGDADRQHEQHATLQDSRMADGIIRVKLSEKLAETATVTENASGKLRSSDAGLDAFFRSIGATSFTRVFPDAGEYEERSRREGLHLWYDVTFGESGSTLRAASEASTVEGIEITEKLYYPTLPKYKVKPIPTMSESALRSASGFNDPGLSRQWHYHNDGSIYHSVKGADINLFEAWKITTGKKNVVVAIVDGGIDIEHPDLKDNLWINEKEQRGVTGKDDDSNEYIDDMHGFNFVSNTSQITPHSHGTHVAGTVAARNNNRKGVAGIAGGDGTPDSGVRLMSCQIFEHGDDGKDKSATNMAAAIKYGADNGAVISQNSWGYGYPGPEVLSPSLAAAIDYFVKYAGCDKDGNQRPDSPMKGGVVIFAAGNEYLDYIAYPAAYPSAVAVAAMAPDFTVSDYSNRGDWVDIMAPGGSDWYPGGEVLSTVPDGKYGYMAGTSMACPHVSGIAALVVSEYGGAGFTNEELRNRLVNSVRTESIDEYNPKYRGRLGNGYIDAAKALAPKGNTPPDAVATPMVSDALYGMTLTFHAVKDKDDVTASSYMIYVSRKPMTKSDYKAAPEQVLTVRAHDKKPNDKIEQVVVSLESNTTYHFAVVAVDRWGLESEPVFVSGKTKANQAPIVTLTDNNPIRISGTQVHEVRVEVKDPEGKEWFFDISGDTEGVSYVRDDSGINLKFRPVGQPGTKSLILNVRDVHGAETKVNIPFETYKNNAPVLVKPFGVIFVPMNKGAKRIKLSEYFTDPDKDRLTYTIRTLDGDHAFQIVDNEYLHINPAMVGAYNIEITAYDPAGGSVKAGANIQIVERDDVYAVYPIPTSDVLNIQMDDKVSVADITVRTTTGILVLQKQFTFGDMDTRHVALDVRSIPVGRYILEVKSPSWKFTKSFIKSK